MFKTLKVKLLLVLVVITFFTYFSSLSNPFIWDDEQFITSNQYVQNFDIDKIFSSSTTTGAGIVSNYYRPLTTLSFAIDKLIWGQNVFGYHLVNLTVHISAGVLLFLLLLEIGIGQWGSFFITLFFLIHPIQTEAVTYINSRGDSLYAMFLFGSLWVFAKGMKAKVNKLGWVGVILLYILSILSKETAIAAFPLFFVLIFIKVFKNPQKFSQSIQLYIMPLFVAGLSVVTVTLYAFLRLSVLNFQDTLNYYTGATFYSTHLFVRLFTFARVLWVYIGLLLWPYPLHMERSVALVTSVWSWEVWGILGLVFSILYLVFWEIRKNKSGIILLGLAFSTCLLIPVSGIIPINGILYEHWLYVPMVGVAVMVYGVVSFWGAMKATPESRNDPEHPKGTSYPVAAQARITVFNKILFSFALLLIILYIVLTVRQNNIWADPVVFYRYTLSFAPDSARLHNNLGMSLANIGDTKDSIVEYEKALNSGLGYPEIYNNLGNAEIATGSYKDAEKNLKKALQLAPQFTVAKNNLFKLYLLTKQYDKARRLYGNDIQVEQMIQKLEHE